MVEQRKIQLFEEEAVPKAVFTLAIPTILSCLVMVIYNLADTYFVGMLNDPVENAAVTLAAPVLLAFNAVNNLFGVGSSSMMSRALGKREYETVRRSSAFGFYCALLSGILFSIGFAALQQPVLNLLGADAETMAATSAYLKWTVICGAVPAILNVVMAYLVRAEGCAIHASIGTMSGCFLNILLDPVFIMPWGLGMGAAGAGLATFISNCVACVYFLVLMFVRRKRTYISMSPKALCMEKGIVYGVCGVGIPAAASFGSDAVAAMGIAQKINMVPMYVALGLSQGIMPLLSYNFGSGNIRRFKAVLWFCMRVAVAFMAVVSVAYFCGARWLVTLFMENESIVSYGYRFLRGLCLAMPFLCTDFLAVGVFQACGMGKRALSFAILRKIVLEIPALFLWNALCPLYGLAYAQPTAEIILAAAAMVTLRRLSRELEARKSMLGNG